MLETAGFLGFRCWDMAEGVSKETQMSLAASSMFPGFRFSPTDVELISYYLKKKLDGEEKCVEVISDVEICKFEPWDLPATSIIKSENEWFFFCARGRKYPNGTQSRRATEQGYWKATGKERNVKSGSNVIGTKRTLVFHIGRAPKGERTEWIMHEYSMNGISQDSLVICRLKRNVEFCPNRNPNRTKTRRQPSTVPDHDSNHAASEGAISEGDKGGESCSKKCSSSHDSHSIEQNGSTSEFTPTESCSQHKDFVDEADYFAEILNDDIIKLDETSLSAKPNFQAVIPDTSRYQSQEMSSNSLTFQGTANRRIKLSKELLDLDKDSMEKHGNPRAEKFKFRVISVIFIAITLLALLLSLLGSSKPLRSFHYFALYNDL